MSRWVCPRCDREFGRANQGHVCVPGGTVDQSFAGRPPEQREIYDVLIAHWRSLGPVHEDAVGVGVFLKHETKFAEVRPMARALSVELVLPDAHEHPRLSRRLEMPGGRYWHVLRLTAVDQIDDGIRKLVTLAYDAG